MSAAPVRGAIVGACESGSVIGGKIGAPEDPCTRAPRASAQGDPAQGQGLAGDVRPGAEDRAAGFARTAIRAGDDVEVAQIIAAEAEAGDHGERDVEVRPVAPVGLEDGDAAVLRVGDPYRTIGRDLEAIGAAVEIDEGSPALDGAAGADVVDPHHVASRVR